MHAAAGMAVVARAGGRGGAMHGSYRDAGSERGRRAVTSAGPAPMRNKGTT